MDVLAFPFKLNQDGSVAKVVQGSSAHQAQQIAALIRTRTGELDLAPGYGIVDATFGRTQPGEIEASLNLYNPDIIVESVESLIKENGQEIVNIRFADPEAYYG